MIERYWTFKAFKGSRNEIDEQLDDLDPEPKQKIKAFIRRMENIEKWDSSYFKPLVGYHGIYEIKIKFKRVQYRPLGCYGPGRKEFTLLIGAIEKGSKLTPKDAAQKAQERCKLIRRNVRYVDDFQ